MIKYVFLILFCFSSNAFAQSEETDIRNRINKIAIEIARCNGIFRADGITIKSTGLAGNTYKVGLDIISTVSSKELRSIEEETYKKVKQVLQKNTAEDYQTVEHHSGNCILQSIGRYDTVLKYFKRIGIDF